MDQLELTTIPAIGSMITLASQSGWEMIIIILIIVLILFGWNRLPDLARGMGESIRNFKAGAHHQQRRQIENTLSWKFLALTLIVLLGLLVFLTGSGFSDEQKMVLTIVALGWIGV